MHACGEYVAFPGRGGNFVAFELRDHRGETFHAFRFGSARDSLPIQQESHEVRAGHRLDLRAQGLDGVTMNARQQPALAPFERGVTPRHGLGHAGFLAEAAAQHEAFAFELDEGHGHIGDRQRQR
jgi:hypothetical protein